MVVKFDKLFLDVDVPHAGSTPGKRVIPIFIDNAAPYDVPFNDEDVRRLLRRHGWSVSFDVVEQVKRAFANIAASEEETMGNRLQERRDAFQPGDKVLVSGHGRLPRKAVVRHVESSTVKVRYSDKKTGEDQRVRLKDVQHDPEFAEKPDASKAKIGDVVTLTMPKPQPPEKKPEPPKAVAVAPQHFAPISGKEQGRASSGPSNAALQSPPKQNPTPMLKNTKRLSTFMREWRTEFDMTQKQLADLAGTALPLFRIPFIELQRFAAEDHELEALAPVMSVSLAALIVMRDNDLENGVTFRQLVGRTGIKKNRPAGYTRKPRMPPPGGNTERLSYWLRDWRHRRGFTVDVAVTHIEGLPAARFRAIELRVTAAEDDELLSLAAYLEKSEEKGIDWLERLSKMRDADVDAGVRYRERKNIHNKTVAAAPAPAPVVVAPPKPPAPVVEAPKPPPAQPVAPVVPPPPPFETVLPPLPVAEPPKPTPAPLNLEALPTKMKINVGGVDVEGSPEDIRRLLGLK